MKISATVGFDEYFQNRMQKCLMNPLNCKEITIETQITKDFAFLFLISAKYIH